MQDLNDQVLGGTLTFSQFNQLASELQNLMTNFGASLSGANLFQLVQGTLQMAMAGSWATVTGTNTLTADMAHGTLSSYQNGQLVRFRPANANTGAVTINVDTLGAKDVTLQDGTALSGGELTTGADVTLRYNASADDFLLLDSALPSLEVDLGETVISNDATVVVALPSIYREYKIEVRDIVPSTDGNRLSMEVSTNNGSTYRTGSNDYLRYVIQLQSSGQQNLTNNGNRIYLMDSNAQGLGDGITPREYFDVDIRVKPGDGTIPFTCSFNGRGVSDNNTGYYTTGMGAVHSTGATADRVTHVRFKASASEDTNGGNLESGTIRVIGIL